MTETLGTSSNCSTVPSLPVNDVQLAPNGSDEVSALSLQSASVMFAVPNAQENKAWLRGDDSRTAYTRAEI